jgi:hypothetical protein
VEPFSITCTTCQAKLKVRSAAAIGQILSCPKCESMVQVVAPPGWQPENAASSAAAAQVKASSPTGSSIKLPREAAPPSSGSMPASSAPAASPAADELSAAVADAAAAFEDFSHLPVGSVSPTPPQLQLPPLSADWASPTEALWRKVAMYAVAGGTAAVVLSLALTYFLSGDDSPPVTEQVAAADVDPAATEPDPGKTVDVPAAKTTEPATQEAPQPKPEIATESLLPPVEKSPAVEAVLPTDTQPLPTEKTTPAAKNTAQPPNAAETPATVTTPDGTETSPASESTAPAPPLDAAKLLADASLETLLPADAPSPDAALTVPVKEMTQEELAAAAAADPPASERAGSSLEAAGPVAAVRRIPNESTAPLQPAEEMLRLQLPQVTFHNIPLALLLGELSDLSTLPMTFDLNALSAANISPDVLVSVSASDKTLAEILTKTLADEKLTYFTDKRHVIVTTPSAAAAPRTVKFSVEDLASGEDQLRELAALIVKMVAPESWQFADGPGKIELENNRLSLEQSGSVVFESVVFCERLRTARGLATRSRLPADQLLLTSAHAQAKAHLARKVACTFHAPTRLVDVVRYLEELSGAKILIDWRSLSSANFNPQDMITCALPEQPLSNALDALLSPLGLTYRVVNKDTLEVFTQQDLPTKMTREFYSLQSLMTSGVKLDVLLTAIRQLTGEDAWAHETTGLYFYDPASQHLIVRHGNYVHGQIEHLLDEAARKLAGKKAPAGKG